MRKILTHAQTELLAGIKALHMYPLGFIGGREPLIPHDRKFENSRPVLLVHGMAHNASAFIPLKQKLKMMNWQNVCTMNYSTRHGSLTRMVDALSKKVEEVLLSTQSEKIDIVGHSLGGIVARYYMSLGSGRGKVGHLVTLGTPHRGVALSHVFRRGRLAGFSDLRSGSYTTRLLNETSLPNGSRITSLYSKNDIVVWPGENCRVGGFPGAAFRNVELNHIGHLGLLHNQDSFDEVIKALIGVD